jgi:glycine/D-amino acid oxidase-like deaminating enzyme
VAGSEQLTVSWKIPVKTECEVCVVGGGSAGVAAAVASSRAGARTVLVEKYGFLGGTATAGLVGPMMTSYSSDGREPVIAGVFREVVDRMVRLGGAIDPAQIDHSTAYSAFIRMGHARVTPFHPEAMKAAMLDIVEESGARTLYHTCFVKTLVHERHLTGVVVHDKAGLGAVRARVFVDATGDADVAADAGVPCRKGREADGRMMPATLFMRFGDVDDAMVEAYARAHPGKRMFEEIVTRAREAGSWSIPRQWLNLYREPHPGEYRVNITRLLDIDGTDPDDLSRAEVEGRRQCLEVFRFMKAHCPGLERARLLETAAQIGIRETRHIQGLYTLTAEDVLAGRRFADAIARCAYPIDIHDPTGSGGRNIGLGNTPEEPGKGVATDAPRFYDIPYRCLVPVHLVNLLVAGRPLSATHEAAASARVMPPCYATGQAAGLAAALCAQGGIDAAAVDVQVLRQALKGQGAIV